jgi:hypothetical protein
MESHAPEVKVPIRLTTRDPTIELTQDAGVMLVQTCKSKGVEIEQLARDALWYAQPKVPQHTDNHLQHCADLRFRRSLTASCAPTTSRFPSMCS